MRVLVCPRCDTLITKTDKHGACPGGIGVSRMNKARKAFLLRLLDGPIEEPSTAKRADIIAALSNGALIQFSQRPNPARRFWSISTVWLTGAGRELALRLQAGGN